MVGFKQIADNIPVVLFQVGIRSTGRVEFSYFSEGALDILDIQPSILRAQPEIILKFLSAEDIKKLKESFFDCAANDKVWEDEVVLKIAENCERWIRIRGTIQFSQGIFEISGIIHNITDEKKDLERQYLIKNRLLKIHSHDAIQNGLIEETKKLLSFKEKHALQTVGYKELFDFHEGKTDLEQAILLIKQNSRRYAKRQITWFKRYKDAIWIKPTVFDNIDKFIIQYLPEFEVK
jgi:hypothetical protein